MVEALPVEHFRQQASHMTHQQHLQMGLRKGMAILIYYVVENTHYQAVLLVEESVMNRGRRGENRLWKRVTPNVTEFAWLPPNIAESFCKNALYRDAARTYCAFDTFFLLYAAWVRSRAERPSVSYTKVVMEVAWTGHNMQFTKAN